MLSDYIPSHSGIMALACRHLVDWRPRVPPHFWLSLSWSLSKLKTLSSFFMLQSTCIQSCIKISCIQFSLAQCFLSSLREHICFVYLCVFNGALCKVGTQSILLNSSTQLLRLLKLKPITKVSCFISFKFQSKVSLLEVLKLGLDSDRMMSSNKHHLTKVWESWQLSQDANKFLPGLGFWKETQMSL